MSVDVSAGARNYWDAAADSYDHDFAGTLIGRTRREAVWRDLDRLFHPGQRVLELNCGTGIDAVHLARRGVHIIACDVSPRMIELARERARTATLTGTIDFCVLANEEIARLIPQGQFDGAFSNFSGLNCVADLSGVARDLQNLLLPGAPALLCMIGRFVPWEFAWFIAHGDFRRALQRRGRGMARAVEGGTLLVQYPPVDEIARAFAPGFRLRRRKGIGIAVPPSYMEHWARRFPAVTRALAAADGWLGSLALFRDMADCVLMELERNHTAGDPDEAGQTGS